MPIQRATSVERLYRACRDYDLVLVPDPPLASALNRRLDAPRFGRFATTPRRLAAGHREPAEDRIAFLEVIEETDLDWKAAAYAVGNVIQCWEHEGTPEAILAYDSFDTPATRAVISCLAGIETTSSRLASCDIEDETDVAVLGIDEFTPLERSILPETYDEIDLLSTDPFEHPSFRIFDSPAAIIDTILESVTAENADRVAIVLDRSSQFSPLVEAALEAADVPFYGGSGFTDRPDHRTFLRLLRAAHAGSEIRLAHVRPILERLGASVDVEHDEKRLHVFDHPNVAPLTDLLHALETCSFAEALSACESVADVDLDAFRAELDRLGLLSEPVTESAVGDLEFYVQTYEVPVDRQNDGVLLADANAAATVDRPAVFYLGMDEGWTHSSPRRPWVDRDREFTRHLQQFQRLLQNGVTQYYLVLDERGGRPVTPCLYFEELFDETVEQFSDLDSVAHPRTFQPVGSGFDCEPLGIPSTPVTSISQSGLNRFVNCPRDLLFDRLVDGPDKDYFAVGNLFHDFAEVYVNHPGQIDDEVMADVVDLMLETTRPFDREVDRAINRTRYRIGLETIVEFLDTNPPVGAGFLTGSRGWWSNDVADALGLEVDAPHTEWWFDDADLGLKGKIDLVYSPAELLDYKSGTKHSAAQVVRQSALDPPHDTPNFQAISYLTYHRSVAPDEPLAFTFFHFLETIDDAVAGEATLDDCLTTVTYHPVTFAAYIARESVFEALQNDGAGDCTKTFSQLSFDDYVDIVAGHPFPDTRDSDALLASPFGQAILGRAKTIVGEYKYVQNGCVQALRYLRDLRDANYFADDLDAFESFVDARIEELNRYRSGEQRFPVEGLGGDPNYRRVDNRDMILEGDA